MERSMAWLACFIVLGAVQVPLMWRKKDVRSMLVVGILLLFGAAYTVAYSLDMPLPDPNGLIRLIFEPIGRWVMGGRSL